MKKFIHYPWIHYPLIILVILIGAFCIQAILYPVNREHVNQYVENKYGRIMDRLETKGSMLYLCGTGEEEYLVGMKRSLWLPGRYREEESTTSDSLDMLNGNYEGIIVYKNHGSLEPERMIDVERENRIRELRSMALLCFSVSVFVSVQKRRHGKSRKYES